MVSIRQIHPVFIGEVSGTDLTKPLSKDDAAAIEAGMDRYAVLVFRDQRITDDQQMEFSKNFGAIENAKGGNITKDHELRLKPGMIDDRVGTIRRRLIAEAYLPSDTAPRAVELPAEVGEQPAEVGRREPSRPSPMTRAACAPLAPRSAPRA